MSARRSEPIGLSRAQQRIEGLLEDLNRTVDSVDELARSGHPDHALRLVEDQRRSLRHFVHDLAGDIAPKKRRLLCKLHVRLALAAAVAGVLTLGFALGWLSLGHGEEPPLATSPASIQPLSHDPVVDVDRPEPRRRAHVVAAARSTDPMTTRTRLAPSDERRVRISTPSSETSSDFGWKPLLRAKLRLP